MSLAEAIIILAAKYGPQLIVELQAIAQKKDPTLADFAALFAKVKPYEAYGIPDVGQT